MCGWCLMGGGQIAASTFEKFKSETALFDCLVVVSIFFFSFFSVRVTPPNLNRSRPHYVDTPRKRWVRFVLWICVLSDVCRANRRQWGCLWKIYYRFRMIRGLPIQNSTEILYRFYQYVSNSVITSVPCYSNEGQLQWQQLLIRIILFIYYNNYTFSLLSQCDCMCYCIRSLKDSRMHGN